MSALRRSLMRLSRRRAGLIALIAFLLIVVEPYYHVRYTYHFDRPVERMDTTFYDECITPEKAAASTPRESAVIFMLARNEEADKAARTVRNLERNFNRWYKYPWVFLNDEPFDERFITKVSKYLTNGTTATFHSIGSDMWGWPAQFGEKQQANAIKMWDDMVDGTSDDFKKGVKVQKTGYHHMCRFNSGFFYDHPAMQEYKWYWRVEPGVSFTCEVPYDPFHHMAIRNKTYGYTIALWEVGRMAPNLFRATSDFADKLPGRRPALWQAMHEPSWAPWPIRRYIISKWPSKNSKGDGWSMCHFWSNFEIADLDFFRSDMYREYFEHLDRLGGFHLERWGDAPIHSLAAAMFLEPEQIHYFEDIGYKHPPFQHCPTGTGCHCSCNQRDSVADYCLNSIRRTVEPGTRPIDRWIKSWSLEERRCICRDVLALYGSIVAVATYTSAEPESVDLLRDRIVKALKLCILQHPVLSTVILDADTDRPLLARPDSIDLDHHLRFLPSAKDPSDIDAYLEDIHNDPFPELHLHPSWRLYVRPIAKDPSAFQAAFAMSHALIDGRSCYIFHKALLSALRQVSHSVDVDESPILHLANSGPLLPSLEASAKFKISWSFLLGPLLKEYSPNFISSWFAGDANKTWAGAEIRPARPRPPQLLPTRVRSKWLHRRSLHKALEMCRDHNARLTAYLNHLVARALAMALQTYGEDYVSFIADTALDMRRCIPIQGNAMGNLVSSVTEKITLPLSALDLGSPLTESEWDAVRHATERLAKASNTLADQPVALLSYLDDFWRWTKKTAEKPSEISFGVSNLGVFDDGLQPAENESWSVRDMAFSQSADATGAPFNLNIASTKGGLMMINISWWPGMLGVPNEELFVEDVLSSVEQMVNAE